MMRPRHTMGQPREFAISVHYAAYGSNLHPLRLMERVPSASLIGTGFLCGHDLRFHKRSADESGKCMIADSGQGVYVAVYRMSHTDKQILDGIEGIGRGYTDGIVDVPGFSDCATYLPQESHINENLLPYDWYLEIVLLGCRYFEFPESYIERIAAVAVTADPDARRSARNWALIERIRRTA